MDSNISSQMTQVQFYSLTLTFQVKGLAFFLFCEYLTNGERSGKYYYCHQIESPELCHCCTS